MSQEMWTNLILSACATLFTAAGAPAQAPQSGQAAPKPEFEVASVKPAGPYVPGSNLKVCGGPGTDDPGQFTYPRASLLDLLPMAYGVGVDQVSGPDWLTTEQYSIAARIPPNTTKDQFNLMLQNLLAERFHLALHHETRDFPVYELVVASGGPKMRPSPPDPDAATAAPAGAGPRFDKDRFPVLPPGSPEVHAIANGMMRSTHRMTMAQFAAELGGMVSLSNGDSTMGVGKGATVPRVVDKTGLTGKFDFTLEFTGSFRIPASVVAEMAARGGEQQPEAIAASDPGGGLSIFTALEKQLGLKLEKGKKASLDLLVIDHAHRVPTEN
jgi:uncharacterized protein (TIGR03435 family)